MNELEAFSPEELSSSDLSELLTLQEGWRQLCQEWRDALKAQELRVENLDLKSNTLERYRQELRVVLQKRAELDLLKEELRESLQSERAKLAEINEQMAESLEDERARQKLYSEREQGQERLERLTKDRADRQLKLGGVEAQIDSVSTDLSLNQERYRVLRSEAGLIEEEISSYLVIWRTLDISRLDQQRERFN